MFSGNMEGNRPSYLKFPSGREDRPAIRAMNLDPRTSTWGPRCVQPRSLLGQPGARWKPQAGRRTRAPLMSHTAQVSRAPSGFTCAQNMSLPGHPCPLTAQARSSTAPSHSPLKSSISKILALKNYFYLCLEGEKQKP